MKESKEFEKYAVKHLGIGSLNLHNYNKHMMPMSMTPYIMEERQLNVAQIDVFSRLMMDRIIVLGMDIRPEVANIVNAQLLFLESVDRKKEIQLYLNSHGGSCYDGLSIIDTMNYISPEVSTTVTGLAASMGFLISTSGAKGKRRALKHSRLMIHQPLSGIDMAQASDIEIVNAEVQKLKKELYTIVSENTGKDYDQIVKDGDRNFWLTATEALEYGAIDEILVSKKKK